MKLGEIMSIRVIYTSNGSKPPDTALTDRTTFNGRNGNSSSAHSGDS